MAGLALAKDFFALGRIDEPQQFLQEGHPLDGHVITVQVMAVADVSPAHQHPVRTALKRF